MLLQPRLSASFIPISGVDIIQHRTAMGLGLRSSLWDLQLICFKRHSVGRKTIHSTVFWHPTRPSPGFMWAETRARSWQLAGHRRNDDHESLPSQSKSSCISIVVVLLVEVSMVLLTVLTGSMQQSARLGKLPLRPSLVLGWLLCWLLQVGGQINPSRWACPNCGPLIFLPLESISRH